MLVYRSLLQQRTDLTHDPQMKKSEDDDNDEMTDLLLEESIVDTTIQQRNEHPPQIFPSSAITSIYGST
jgi:hypothetical protein